jgi:hypothetical protein
VSIHAAAIRSGGEAGIFPHRIRRNHYLLAVHSVEGESREPMSDEQMQAFMGRINELEEENQSTLRGPRRS